MVLQNLAAYEYTTTTVTTTDVDSWMSSGTGMFVLFLIFALSIFLIASMWKIFTKAGRPGWAAIIPIYNTLQLIWTAGKPWWWFLLMLIPVVNIVVVIALYYNLAKAFGKGVGFTVLLLILPIIGFPMLAWGNATYRLKKPAGGR